MEIESAQVIDCMLLSDVVDFLQDLEIEDDVFLENKRTNIIAELENNVIWLEQTLYDTFAHRLGPDEWDECKKDIFNVDK